MKLTPLDIRRNEFTRSFRGYNREEVESFLTMVADEVEGLVGDHREASRRVEELEKEVEEYRAMERTLSETLVSTQRTADDMRDASQREAEITRREAQVRSEQLLDNARIEAERLVLQARRQAYQIIEEARQKAQKGLEDARSQADEMYKRSREDFLDMRRQIENLTERRDSYVESMRGYLNGQLGALNTIGSEKPPKIQPPKQTELPTSIPDGAEVLAELDRELAEFAEATLSATMQDTPAPAKQSKPKADAKSESKSEQKDTTPPPSDDGAEVLVENRPREGRKS